MLKRVLCIPLYPKARYHSSIPTLTIKSHTTIHSMSSKSYIHKCTHTHTHTDIYITYIGVWRNAWKEHISYIWTLILYLSKKPYIISHAFIEPTIIKACITCKKHQNIHHHPSTSSLKQAPLTWTTIFNTNNWINHFVWGLL